MAERWKWEVGSLETRLSAGEEHAKKKSPIGRHDGSASDGSLEGMKCPHESYFGNQYSWLHCRPDDDTLPTVAQPVTPTYQARSSTVDCFWESVRRH